MSLSSLKHTLGRTVFASAMSIFLLPSPYGRAEQSPRVDAGPPSTADLIADVFSQVGDEIYANCVFELSEEQIAVQHALITAYMQQGATGAKARRLAATQIQVPKVSEKCEQVRVPEARSASLEPNVSEPKRPVVEADPKPSPPKLAQTVLLKGKKTLANWDCAPGVDYVTIHLNGFERKLTGGEICNPYEDVVREVSPAARSFRLGYTIKTGRLFVISDDPQVNGQTITWGISGRDICRNNPDPDCLAARAVGPLPPGEYTFAADKSHRVNWGPKTKRSVAGIYLKKLWNKDWFSPQHTDAILARRNIAIHVRLKGEMSEACIGLEPNGWAYVSTLIKDMRATGLNVYIDEPYPQMAEPPPVIVASSFSLTSLFK